MKPLDLIESGDVPLDGLTCHQLRQERMNQANLAHEWGRALSELERRAVDAREGRRTLDQYLADNLAKVRARAKYHWRQVTRIDERSRQLAEEGRR